MAANRIKGITIEIGGDTTKLDKALSGTNKGLSDTKKSLKDVERLLKLDPGNTVLLEQKQRLLAESVEGTAQKLETLRAAAAQADDALARGTAYEERFEPLKKALEETNTKLERLKQKNIEMDASFQSGEISPKKYEAFQKKLQDTQQQFDSLTKAKKSLDEEFEGTKLNQKQYDALQRELVETEKAAKDAEEAFECFNAAAEQVGASAGEIADGAEQVGTSAGKIADGAGKVQNATAGISTAATGILVAAAATVPATEEFRNSMATLRTGADEAGVGFSTAEAAMKNFMTVSGELDSSLEATSNLLQAGFTQSNLQEAVENLAGAYLRFPDTLKIESLADSLQETLATGEATGQFGELLDRLGVGAEQFSAQLALIPDEVNRQNYALGVLASQGLSQTYDSWIKNNEAVVQSREANYEFQRSMAELAQTIQPFITQMTEFFTSLLGWFNDLPPQVQTFIGVLLVLVAAISPVAGIIASIGLAVSAAGASMSAFLPVILAVTVALIALAAIIAIISGKSDDLDAAVDAAGAASATPSGGARGGAAPSAFSIPALASGSVVRPNSPFLAVLGDNPREPEVVSPLSTMQQAMLQALEAQGGGRAGGSGSGPLSLSMELDGAKFARLIVPYLSRENSRAGVNILGR